ncbi:TPR-like protein [Lophium mytilinum]|uniref:ER membrane protein complex subunit 2 n=1 Tax=Lophium mytilinum TaxID=390894 RepID=A0A6A6R4L5_9PEZI|nr:TPR-like protein [Lophium mytilinum]
MSATLLDPPPHISPPTALHLSQQAPLVLASSPASSLPWPISLLTSSETPETWSIHENLLLACLRTGDDRSARQVLDRMVARFGDENERVMALRGLYEEAVARDKGSLEKVLKEYETTIKDDPTNMPIRKRHIALLRSLGRPTDAIAALTYLVDSSPTDAEAWAELADLYASQNLLPQAIYSLEEVLLITPNAWNIHARIGELLYLSAISNGEGGASYKGLAEAMRRFCRSVELNDGYLRGFYGLKLTTSRLLTLQVPKRNDSSAEDLPLPPVTTIEKLNELATTKLAEIVRRGSAKESGWGGYEEAELIAARELLNRDGANVVR